MSEKFEKIKTREEQLLCRSYGRYPLAIVKADGARLIDADGREYVDLLAGIGVANLGHCNEELTAVIEKQARKLIHVSNLFYQEEQLEFARRLLATADLDKAFFCNSGAEANEAAMKLARRYMQRVKNKDAGTIITLSGAFHGRTLAAVAATGQQRFTDGFEPLPLGFCHAAWGDIDALEAAIAKDTAAIMIEVVQGEGGIRPMSQNYAQGIEALCRKHDILLICDEVQSGMGRTGRYWSYQHFGLKPDIVSSSKALANGLPLGAMMTNLEVSQGFITGSHGTTFGGGALVTAVGTKILEIMERDNIPERAAKSGARFMEKIRSLAARLPGTIAETRGLGLMIGIELAFPGKVVWEALLAKGFVLNLTQEKVLRLLPPLTIAETDLDAFALALEDVLRSGER
jgi:acetylornithine aminotransferase